MYHIVQRKHNCKQRQNRDKSNQVAKATRSAVIVRKGTWTWKRHTMMTKYSKRPMAGALMWRKATNARELERRFQDRLH